MSEFFSVLLLCFGFVKKRKATPFRMKILWFPRRSVLAKIEKLFVPIDLTLLVLMDNLLLLLVDYL